MADACLVHSATFIKRVLAGQKELEVMSCWGTLEPGLNA